MGLFACSFEKERLLFFLNQKFIEIKKLSRDSPFQINSGEKEEACFMEI